MIKTDEVVFQTEREAYSVLDSMKSLLAMYEQVTVADFLELSGIASTYVDSKVGWTGLSTAKVKEAGDGYVLDLQPAKELR